MKQKHIYRLIFFFVMAFALGSLVGKIYSHFTSDPRSDLDSTKNSQTSSASMTFQNENWGLGFQEEGKRPTGNASMEELKKFARYGNAVASLCIEKKGGILSIPEEKETFKRLQISV